MNEALIEKAALAWLSELGFATVSGIDIGPDGVHAERKTYGDVALTGRLRSAIARLNPNLSQAATASSASPPVARRSLKVPCPP
jgi:type I restriction enzyme R subunit